MPATEPRGPGYLLVIPSDMMSVILQQDEIILMLSLSTTSTCNTGAHGRGLTRAPCGYLRW